MRNGEEAIVTILTIAVHELDWLGKPYPSDLSESGS